MPIEFAPRVTRPLSPSAASSAAAPKDDDQPDAGAGEPSIGGIWGVVDGFMEAVGLRLKSNGVKRTSVPVDAPWLGGVENAQEVFGAKIVTLEGELPPGLRGTLLRNGPGRMERGGERVPHWFDGDGAILRIAIDGEKGQSTVDYRFIRTADFEEEEAANRYTRPVFGYLPEGSPVRRSLVRSKNPANTNVVPFGDRLLALYEGDRPVELDRDTLQTVGEVNLGALRHGDALTAHPHRDADGRTWGFALNPGPGGGGPSLVELDATGEIVRRKPFPALVSQPHDFISAGPFLVFIDTPTHTDALPALIGLRAIGDSITWNEGKKNRIHVVDKESLELVVSGSSPAFSSAHFAGGRLEDDGTVSFIAFVPEKHDPSGESTERFIRGEEVKMGATPTRFHIDPKTGDVVQKVELSTRRAEWPVEDPRQKGQAGDEIWCATQSEDAGYFDGYGRLNRHTGFVDEICLPEGTFGNEPKLCPDAQDPSKMWLVTIQYVSDQNQSQMVVYDADDLAAGAIYRGALPTVIPFGFHGSITPAV